MKRSELIFSSIALPWDSAMLLVAGIISYVVRFRFYETFGLSIPTTIYSFDAYLERLIVVIAAIIFLFAWSGLYRMRSTRKFLDDIPRIISGCSTALLGVIVFLFFQREVFLSRFIVLLAWGLSILLVLAGRLILTLTQRVLFRYGIGVHRVALVGGGEVERRIGQEIQEQPMLGYRIVQTYSNVDSSTIRSLIALHQSDKIDEIIMTNPELSREPLHALGDASDEYHIPLRYAVDLFPNHRSNLVVSTLVSTPLVEIRRTPLQGWWRIVKRLFDIVIASILIIIFSPVMLFVALAILIDSGSPVLFSRLPNGAMLQRVGTGMRLFRYYKFRTMILDAHALRYSKAMLNRNVRQDGPMVKIPNDPRVTVLGRILRRFSIDELPELFLVFKGSMSLVGPRPHLPEEVARYERHHKAVFEVKPGITGLAQVSGRHDLNFEEEVRLDRHYIEHWTLLLDIWILLKTPWVVAKGTKDV